MKEKLKKSISKNNLKTFLFIVVFGSVFFFLGTRLTSEEEVSHNSFKSVINTSQAQANSNNKTNPDSLTKNDPEPKKAFEVVTAFDENSVSAAAVLVYDIKSDMFIMKKNSDTKRQIASLTKLMTALLIDKYGNFNDKTIVGRYAVMTYGYSGGLREKEEISIESLLKLLLIDSSNDSGVVLSEYMVQKFSEEPIYDYKDIQSSKRYEKIFVDIMNDEVKKLNLKSTNYTNPHGLDNYNAYSTAEDITKIFVEVLKRPALKSIIGIKSGFVESADGKYKHELKNTNQFLGIKEGVKGGKTGSTGLAKENLVILWENPEGREIVITVLGSDNRYKDMEKILDWLNSGVKF